MIQEQLPVAVQNILKNKKHPCYAPYLALNFDITGDITVCCINRKYTVGKYPENSIKEAWFGKKMQAIRESLQNLDFSKGCQLCHKHLLENNYQYSHLKDYDIHYKEFGIKPFPQLIELEISNICNYECIMCGGKWSSSIRKNREKLPPIKTPYDDNFIEQLKFFLPHLKLINFLGGEPFANPLYYKLWKIIPDYNKHIKYGVTTNGSVYNSQIEELLQTKRFDIICSLDSLQPDTYKIIRKNGNLEDVLKNLEKFIQQKSLIGITYCPMIQNWREIPEILEFCKKNKLTLYFNNVQHPLGGRIKGIHENGTNNFAFDSIENPKVGHQLTNLIPEVSLYTLPREQREEICSYLQQTYNNYPEYKQTVMSLVKSLQIL